MVGGRDYGASQFNRATDALRQPGSSFKVFVYLTAVMTGKYHKDTPIDASSVCIGDYCVHNYAGESAGVIPIYSAIAQSLNTAAIRLSIKIGEFYWPPKQSYHLGKIATLGRSKIVETARKMGITTPLVDTVSLPVGADEVKMIDMLGANATFANGGKRATPYAAIDIRNSAGALIYTHEANGPAPIQVIPADKIAEMNNILTHVVTEGTGRAAQLPGIVVAGKTGTTNNSTNAWFNGFSGNLVGSVWFGNDDNAPMENLTGGILPAQTWHDIMLYAHQGLDIKPPYGVAPGPAKAPETAAADAPAADGGAEAAAPRPVIALSPRAAHVITEIGDLARIDKSRSAELTIPISVAAQASPGVADAAHP
jgi:penicillin-binding protein 1A